ncbi:RNA methyltransferase [Aquibium carbonis]|uniref:RNA methyltransferase n=1 Tax=Aquibium carbonis TaxID=2495581 RepID=A0A429YLZ5_9HYPH|nr:TfoX/Sxy family protein [Aquibium carbonis]RST82433.1 RNA methyltransferase [Aquibium carbonis]
MTNELAERIRSILEGDPNVGEIRMFGGVCLTLNGNMLVGSMNRGDLLVRVGAEREAEALARPGASRMDFSGRRMTGFVVVANDAVAEDHALAGWIATATAFVGPLPEKLKADKAAKPKKTKAARRSASL